MPGGRFLEVPMLTAGAGSGQGVGGRSRVHLLRAKPSFIRTKDVPGSRHPCFWDMGLPAGVVPDPHDTWRVTIRDGTEDAGDVLPCTLSLPGCLREGVVCKVAPCRRLPFSPLERRNQREQLSSLSPSSVAALGSGVCTTPGIVDQTQPKRGPWASAHPWRGRPRARPCLGFWSETETSPAEARETSVGKGRIVTHRQSENKRDFVGKPCGLMTSR